jgi:hypothetical protein
MEIKSNPAPRFHPDPKVNAQYEAGVRQIIAAASGAK